MSHDCLNPGDRVRFIGMVMLGVPFGAEGTVRHVDGPDGTFVVEFPAGPFVCWRSELELVEPDMIAVGSGDDPRYSVMRLEVL